MGMDRRNETQLNEADSAVDDTTGHGSESSTQSPAEANLDEAQRQLQETVSKAKDKTEEAGHSLAGPLDK